MYTGCTVEEAKQRAFSRLGKVRYSQPFRDPTALFPTVLDCSSFMGWVWRIPNPYLVTDSMPGYLESLGFQHLPYGVPLEDGDILVTAGKGHTGMYVQPPFPHSYENVRGFDFIHCTGPGVILGNHGYRAWGHVLRSNNGGIRIIEWENKSKFGGSPSFNHR